MSEKGDFAAPSDVIKCEGLLKDVCDNRDLRAPFFSPETTYEIPLQVQHKHKESEITESETYTFSGRYITIVVNTSPLEVKKCFVKPKIISKLGLDLLAEQMLRKICGRNNLRDVMLLITPVNDSSITDRYKMHCFDLSTERHLGVTSLTSRERELIENYHSPKNFILLFSTRNIDLQDLVKNSSIKMEIFGTAKKRSTTVTRVLYQGTAVDVCVQSCKKVRVGVSLDCKSFDNKTLKKPKIRVHSNQHLVSDSIDYTGLYKSYGQKHCTTSNLAQCRRLDYPGFGRRALKLIVHHRQRTYSIGSVEQCLNLKAKLLESQKKNVNLDNKSETKLKEVGYDSNSVRNVKKTDLSTEKRKIFLEKAKKPEEKPNAIKMTLEMARKMRAQCDRQKAHIAGERLRKRNDLVRQTVDCFKNVQLEIRDIAKSTSLETNIAKMNATSKDKTTSSRPLIFKNYLKAAPTTKSISKDSAKDQSSSSGRETYLKAVETPTTQPISKDQSTSMETYIAEINENEKDQTSSGLLH
ncbi:uncharacterized protein LOC124459662 [Drosophila willistoni]|uniref:uncharacterized protein LOC124459662 n=1 Tax=Drosophila willistoni TaxID=7260 RepID=UPI000C26CC53|nr:uncharacterized protein LOC124459662 [Drosophila willistoni]